MMLYQRLFQATIWKELRSSTVQQSYPVEGHIVVQQQKYLEYALAAEKYVKKPTIYNWEKKEKAFETYNALIKGKKIPA
jgi:hypothetical protein